MSDSLHFVIHYPSGLTSDVKAHYLDGVEQLALQVGGAEAYLNRETARALADYIQRKFP